MVRVCNMLNKIQTITRIFRCFLHYGWKNVSTSANFSHGWLLMYSKSTAFSIICFISAFYNTPYLRNINEITKRSYVYVSFFWYIYLFCYVAPCLLILYVSTVLFKVNFVSVMTDCWWRTTFFVYIWYPEYAVVYLSETIWNICCEPSVILLTGQLY